jgi:formamidopyrimidine-DNA glycosylase
LIVRGEHHQAVLWNGPVLDVGDRHARALSPDILADLLDACQILERFRRLPKDIELGVGLLDQRCVAGVGKYWRAEDLLVASLPP